MQGKYILEKIIFDLESAIDDIDHIRGQPSVSFFIFEKLAQLKLNLTKTVQFTEERKEEML